MILDVRDLMDNEVTEDDIKNYFFYATTIAFLFVLCYNKGKKKRKR